MKRTLLLVIIICSSLSTHQFLNSSGEIYEGFLVYENMRNSTISGVSITNIVLNTTESVLTIRNVNHSIISNINISEIQTQSSTSFHIQAINLINCHNVTLSHISINDITATSVIGIRVLNSTNLTFQNITITGIKTGKNERVEASGMFLHSASNITIINSRIEQIHSTGVQGSNSYGISIENVKEFEIINSTLNNITSYSSNSKSLALHLLESHHVSIRSCGIHDIVSLISDNNQVSSLSTGIYLAFGSDVVIKYTQINNLISTGEVSYGILIFESHHLTLFSNNIKNILTFGHITRLAAGIIFRDSYAVEIFDNNIEFLYNDNIGEFSHSVAQTAGIVSDVSNQVLISNNFVHHFQSTSVNPTNGISGIIVNEGQELQVTHNFVGNFSTTNTPDTLNTGISISSANLLTVRNNTINSLYAATNYPIFMSSSKDTIIIDNHISELSPGKIRAIYVIRSSGINVSRNAILNISEGVSQAIRLAWVQNSTLESNSIIDSKHGSISIGMAVKGDSSVNISNNIITNKSKWLEVDTKVEIQCNANQINNRRIDGCEFKDVIFGEIEPITFTNTNYPNMSSDVERSSKNTVTDDKTHFKISWVSLCFFISMKVIRRRRTHKGDN